MFKEDLYSLKEILSVTNNKTTDFIHLFYGYGYPDSGQEHEKYQLKKNDKFYKNKRNFVFENLTTCFRIRARHRNIIKRSVLSSKNGLK